MSVGLMRYITPANNLRAADAATAEIPALSGEAQQRQQERVIEPVHLADQQNEEFLKNNLARLGDSRVIHSAGGTPAKSARAASSPSAGPRRGEVVTYGRRNKQMVPYDPK